MNSRHYSKHCIIFWSIVAAVDGQIGVSGLCSKESMVQSAAHAVAADFWIFHCWRHVAQLKCSWKQGVIMRNILSGCGRGSSQSSSIKLAFFSFFPKGLVSASWSSVCDTENSWEWIHYRSFSQEEADVLVWEVQNCRE